MEITKIAIETLSEDPNNVRLHNERNMESIRSSLTNFGQVEPLVVQRSTMRVIGGNGRLRAMRDLGWQEASCALIDIDDARARALGIVLNRTADLAEWDYGALARSLEELTAELPEELSESLGYDRREIAMLRGWADGAAEQAAGAAGDDKQADGARELTPDGDLGGQQYVCPRCGMRF